MLKLHVASVESIFVMVHYDLWIQKTGLLILRYSQFIIINFLNQNITSLGL